MSVTDMDVSETGGRPAPTSARERSRLETRARLMQSGRTLFAERGLRGVTTHDIAKHAGFAAGTFYLHFADKKELFRELLYDLMRELGVTLQRALSSAPDAQSAVRAHVEAVVEFADQNGDVFHVAFGRDAQDVALESDVLDHLAAAGTENVRKRIESGRFRPTLDPRIAAQAMTGMFLRVLMWWLEHRDEVSREDVIRNLIEIQLSGTTPD